ncbi:hypothetical protein [uncultured Neglectibacter sp.]|uniref:hypothetical protein n=1 Tax=uncultured Neglectibacter sp. TaxID=1924108 RepID=UPI0034DF5D1F
MKNNAYTSKTVNKNASLKKAVRPTLLERFLNSGSGYMANYAVVKGSLAPFQNGFFVA